MRVAPLENRHALTHGVVFDDFQLFGKEKIAMPGTTAFQVACQTGNNYIVYNMTLVVVNPIQRPLAVFSRDFVKDIDLATTVKAEQFRRGQHFLYLGEVQIGVGVGAATYFLLVLVFVRRDFSLQLAIQTTDDVGVGVGVGVGVPVSVNHIFWKV